MLFIQLREQRHKPKSTQTVLVQKRNSKETDLVSQCKTNGHQNNDIRYTIIPSQNNDLFLSIYCFTTLLTLADIDVEENINSGCKAK